MRCQLRNDKIRQKHRDQSRERHILKERFGERIGGIWMLKDHLRVYLCRFVESKGYLVAALMSLLVAFTMYVPWRVSRDNEDIWEMSPHPEEELRLGCWGWLQG